MRWLMRRAVRDAERIVAAMTAAELAEMFVVGGLDVA